MELIVAAVIIILYFIFSSGKSTLEKLLPFKICNICSAVSLSWIGLLAAKYFGVFEVDNVLLGVLTGTSVGGIMYQLERFLINRGIPNIWFARISEIVLGILFAYYLTTERWERLTLVAFIIFITGFILFILSKNSPSPQSSGSSKAAAQLRKKLENCCD